VEGVRSCKEWEARGGADTFYTQAARATLTLSQVIKGLCHETVWASYLLFGPFNQKSTSHHVTQFIYCKFENKKFWSNRSIYVKIPRSVFIPEPNLHFAFINYKILKDFPSISSKMIRFKLPWIIEYHSHGSRSSANILSNSFCTGLICRYNNTDL
jgi:hypothetical protein